MKTKTLWKIHSWLGLLAGVPLLVIALTGSVLVFKDELNALLIPERVLVEPLAEGPLPLEERLAVLQAELPDHEVTGWAFYEPPERADFVYVMEHGDNEWLHVYQNQYTGEILSRPGATESELTGWLLVLHYTFLGGHAGMAVCGVLAVLLCLLGATGFFIYRRFWKNLLTFRWSGNLRLLSGDLHKRLGVVSAPVFLILGLTGAYWNLEHVVHEIRAHSAGEDHEPIMERRLYRSGLEIDALARQARETIPGYQIRYLSFPWDEGLPMTFYGEFEQQNPLRSAYHSTVSFDAETGEYLSFTRIDEASAWRQVYDAFTPLHFGTFGGWATRVLWCVLGLAPGLLAVSGSFIWWKRTRPRDSRQTSVVSQAEPVQSSKQEHESLVER